MKKYTKTAEGYRCPVCLTEYKGGFARQEASICCQSYKPFYGQAHLEAVQAVRAADLKHNTRRFDREKRKPRKSTISIIRQLELEFFKDDSPKRENSPLQQLAYAYNHLGWDAVKAAARKMSRHYARLAIEKFIDLIESQSKDYKKDENLQKIMGYIEGFSDQ